MTENNAAQAAMQEAILTDAEIREIQGTHLVTIRSRDALIASVIVAGRAIEQAVLSKLRAEGVQAGDPRAAPIKRYYHGTDCMRETLSGDWVRYDDHVAFLESSHSAGLADAAFLIRWDTHVGEPNAVQPLTDADKVAFSRAALASAPVAGEAQPVAWENFPAYLIDHCEGDTISEEGLQHALSRMMADPKYTAPQASEAVLPPEGVGELQRAVALWLKLKDGQSHPHDFPDVINAEKNVRRILAALAAQPAEEPATSLHSPPASTRQMVDSERGETGNNDGGAHG
ncbi:hypothetical protein D3C87_898230 [compost metagenome]